MKRVPKVLRAAGLIAVAAMLTACHLRLPRPGKPTAPRAIPQAISPAAAHHRWMAYPAGAEFFLTW